MNFAKLNMNKSTIVAFANAFLLSQENPENPMERPSLKNNPTVNMVFCLESRPPLESTKSPKCVPTLSCLYQCQCQLLLKIFKPPEMDHPEQTHDLPGEFFHVWLGLPGNKPMKASRRSRNRSPPTLTSKSCQEFPGRHLSAVTVATRRLSFFGG